MAAVSHTDLVRTVEAAEIAGVSPATIKRAATHDDPTERLVPAMKLGAATGAYLFRRTDVEQWRDRRNQERAA